MNTYNIFTISQDNIFWISLDTKGDNDVLFQNTFRIPSTDTNDYDFSFRYNFAFFTRIYLVLGDSTAFGSKKV